MLRVTKKILFPCIESNTIQKIKFFRKGKTIFQLNRKKHILRNKRHFYYFCSQPSNCDDFNILQNYKKSGIIHQK